MDVAALKDHLMIYGDLDGQCAKCQNIGVKLVDPICSKCGTEFKHIAFRHVKAHTPKMLKIANERAHINFIDYDDYQKALGAIKAQNFLK